MTANGAVKTKVVVVDPNIHPDGLALLRDRYRLVFLPATSREAEIVAETKDAAAILMRAGRVTGGCIRQSPHLRIIARHGSGTDTVDVPTATEHGVLVTNTGAANTVSVAEYAFALMMAAARKISIADATMRAGAWARDALSGIELDGKCLGVIGLGKIGQRVAHYGGSFGMRIVAYDPFAPQSAFESVRADRMDLDELFAAADVVTLHAQLTAENARMVDAARLGLMRKGAILVNCARGELVDEPALVAALKEGRIGAAALDTFAYEPLDSGNPLRSLPNVVLSPHAAGQTDGARRRMAVDAATAVVDALSGRRPAHVVNPDVLERWENEHAAR